MDLTFLVWIALVAGVLALVLFNYRSVISVRRIRTVSLAGNIPEKTTPVPILRKLAWFLLALIATGIILILTFKFWPNLDGLPWTTFQGLVTAVTLILISFLIPKEPIKWARSSVLVVGALMLVITITFSGFGQGAERGINWLERGVANNDWGPRADDIPFINGGTYAVRRGRTVHLHIQGTVAFTNYIGHCLNFSPTRKLDILSSGDWRRTEVTPLSGKKELITVTSLRKGQDDCQ